MKKLINASHSTHSISLILVGDGGYTLSPIILTPVTPQPAAGTPEHRFNDHLCKTRVRIENTFGIMKEKFRCFKKHRTLHYAPKKPPR